VTYFSSLLEDNGYAVVTAQNGAEWIERVKDARPDLITLDVTMPDPVRVDDVGSKLFMHQDRIRLHGLFGVEDRRKRNRIHADFLRCAEGLLPCLCHNQRNDVAIVSNLVVCEDPEILHNLAVAVRAGNVA
jgi:hypothetical protein